MRGVNGGRVIGVRAGCCAKSVLSGFRIPKSGGFRQIASLLCGALTLQNMQSVRSGYAAEQANLQALLGSSV